MATNKTAVKKILAAVLQRHSGGDPLPPHLLVAVVVDHVPLNAEQVGVQLFECRPAEGLRRGEGALESSHHSLVGNLLVVTMHPQVSPGESNQLGPHLPCEKLEDSGRSRDIADRSCLEEERREPLGIKELEVAFRPPEALWHVRHPSPRCPRLPASPTLRVWHRTRQGREDSSECETPETYARESRPAACSAVKGRCVNVNGHTVDVVCPPRGPCCGSAALP